MQYSPPASGLKTDTNAVVTSCVGTKKTDTNAVVTSCVGTKKYQQLCNRHLPPVGPKKKMQRWWSAAPTAALISYYI